MSIIKQDAIECDGCRIVETGYTVLTEGWVQLMSSVAHPAGGEPPTHYCFDCRLERANACAEPCCVEKLKNYRETGELK